MLIPSCLGDKERDTWLSCVRFMVEIRTLNHGERGIVKLSRTSRSGCWGKKPNAEVRRKAKDRGGAHIVAKDQDKKAVGERWAAATGNAFEWVTEDRLPGLLQSWFKWYPAP